MSNIVLIFVILLLVLFLSPVIPFFISLFSGANGPKGDSTMGLGPATCPPSIVELIQQADLQADIGSELFSTVSNGTSLDCQLYALIAIANRLGPLSHPTVVGDFGEAAAMHARALTPSNIEAIRQAYLRMPYDPSVALGYFNGLRFNAIDIRDHLKDRIVEDWTFRHPRDENAATWHYNLYLASLGESRAMEKLAQKIAHSENGNDTANFLRSFATLQGPEATKILESYANDQRRTDGVKGLGMGMTIAEMIEQMLAYRK